MNIIKKIDNKNMNDNENDNKNMNDNDNDNKYNDNKNINDNKNENDNKNINDNKNENDNDNKNMNDNKNINDNKNENENDNKNINDNKNENDNDNKYNDKINIIIIGILTAGFIILYSKFKCIYPNYIDILTYKYLYIYDGWNITHIVLYAILTYLYPKEIYIILLIGIVWEIIEHFLTIYKIKNYTFGCKNRNHDLVFVNRFKDIICNCIGITLGYIIYYYINCMNI